MQNISKKALSMLNHLFNDEQTRVIQSSKGLGLLQKQSRILETKNMIYMFISSKEDAIFHIVTNDSKSGIIINNTTNKNDHTKKYIITISESYETYKVDEILYMENPVVKNVKNFDPNKL